MSETKNRTSASTTAPMDAAPRRARPNPKPSFVDPLAAEDESIIDYGPAIDALDDLFGWAFELARKDVAGWPAGERRVRNAQRFVRAVLRGKPPRTEPREDLLFTAALLVRVFEADLGLGVVEVASVLDQLGLPLDHAPTYANPAVAAQRPIAPSTWRHLRAIYTALTPDEAVDVRGEIMRLSATEREDWIADLSRRTVEDGVRIVRAYVRGEVGPPPRRVVAQHLGCGVSACCFRRSA